MTYAMPIVAIMAAVAALVVAARNAKFSKRLNAKLTVEEESTAKKIDLLHTKLNACNEKIAKQAAAADLNLSRQRLSSIEQQQAHCQKEIDHLRSEAQNLAMLPTWHPTRVALLAELRPRLAPITDQLYPVLFPTQIAIDEFDWMYRLRDRKFPYSLTFEEGMMIHYLIAANGLKSGYEIATAFGFSSFFIAMAMEKTGGHLISADAYIEEEMEDFLYDHASTQSHVATLNQLQQEKQHSQLPRGLQFALEGAGRLNIQSQVDYRVACSPEGVPGLLEDRVLDFAFIDGGHFGEQPILDVKSVLPFLHPDRFLMMFHDTQCEAVAKAVHFAAESTGTQPFSIHTRNRIVAVAKGIDAQTLQTCRAMTVRQPV